jgi:hypothetical protein
MISVGAVVGGPECAFFDARLRLFMRFVREARESAQDDSEVNLVFHLPGSIAKPGYVGPRVAKFSRKDKTLMIQVGVEEEIIRSDSEKDVLQYIYEIADEALGIAKSEFERKSMFYDLEADRQVLDSWRSAVSP